jgi:outer membrane protein assembly factor BamB
MTATVSFGAWRTTRRALAAAAALCALAPAASPAAGCNWPMYGHDPSHTFSQSAACAQINTANVATLTERWFFQIDVPITASATVVNGIAYVGDWSGKMHAVDVATGTEVWNFQIDDLQTNYPGHIVNSAAVDTMRVGASSIRVVVFGGGATLYALDPSSGALLAKQDLDPRTNPDDSHEIDIESSPVIAHFSDGSDRVLVGMDVHNDANVGRTGLHSFQLVENPSGPTPYRFQLVYKFDPETRTVRTSLTDGSGTGRGCGGIWSSPVFDPAAFGGDGLVVFGTSNCGNPDPTHTEAESEGVYALRAVTGALVWEFHPRPYNDDDDDYGASANLLPGGLVGNAGKDGRYYAFDRLTGTRPWTSHPAQSGHVNAQFAIGGIIGTPAVGAVNGEAAIFLASALSTPIGDPNTMTPDPTLAEDPQRMLSLHAISAVDGRILWRSAVARPSFGAPTYANGIVFVPGTVSFSLQAYNANDGTLIAEHALTGAPSSSPTVVGDTIFIGTGTSIDPLPPEAQQHGLHAFSIPAAPLVPGQGILLAPQANELDAYDLPAAVPTTTRSTPIPAHEAHGGPHPYPPQIQRGHGNDSNGQVCELTQADGSVRYLMGEDSDQDLDPGVDGHPSGLYQGWGLYVPTDGLAGPWTITDKLVPTYNFTDPPNDHLPDNTGCAFSKGANAADPADDRLFLVDIGVGAFDVPGIGSLFVYYRDAQGNFSHDSPHCVLDNNLTTAGYLAVDTDGSVLVPESGRTSGGVISRFSPPFPAPASCPDATTQPPWNKTTFIQDVTSFVPISIAKRTTPSGDKWVVGNVVPPMLNEYNLDGTFSRPLVTEQPTPGVAGVAVDANNNVYWANLGLAPCDTILCPVDGLGTLWKLSFDPITDTPLPPVLLQSQLTYPEGMGIADPLPEPSTLLGALAGALALAGLRRVRDRR